MTRFLRDGAARVSTSARVAAVVLAACCVAGLLVWVSADDGATSAVGGPTPPPSRAPSLAASAAPAVEPAPVAVAAPVLQPRLDGELAAAAEPVRIRVPRLAVDSVVVPISGASGVLEPPSDAQQLGWWREGAPPGSAEGSTVMTGHTLHLGGGALDRLKTLRPGDRVVVTTTRGTVRYEVRASWSLSKPALAQRAEEIFDQGRTGRLVLVTCYDWTGSEYLSNAVVSAVPVASTLS